MTRGKLLKVVGVMGVLAGTVALAVFHARCSREARLRAILSKAARYGGESRTVVHARPEGADGGLVGAHQAVLSDLLAMGAGGKQYVTEAARSPEPRVRMIAAIWLGWIGGSDAVGVLERLMRDNDADVVCCAATSLGRIGGPEAVKALVRAVDDSRESRTVRVIRDVDGPLRWPCLTFDVALTVILAEEIGRTGEEAGMECLLRLTRSENRDVAEAAWLGLGDIGTEGALGALAARVAAHPRDCRVEVLALGRSKRPEAIQPLLLALEKGNPLAPEALCTLRLPEVTPLLRAALSSAHSRVRASAAHSLGRIGDLESIPRLEALRSDPVAEVRAAAERTLIGLKGPQTRESE